MDALSRLGAGGGNMKIVMTVELPYDNEIQFFDVCKGASNKLLELGQRALNEGELEKLVGRHEVIADNDDQVVVGDIEVLAS